MGPRTVRSAVIDWSHTESPWVTVLCFFLSCKANARVKPAKTGHGPHSSTLVVICVVRLLFVLFYVWFVCTVLLPTGDNPTAVNKYVNINVNTIRVPIRVTVLPSLIIRSNWSLYFLGLFCVHRPKTRLIFLNFYGWLMNWRESGTTWSWTNQRVILSFVWRARGKMREMSAKIGSFLALFKLGTLRMQASRVTAAVICSDIQFYSKCCFSVVTAAVTCSVMQCYSKCSFSVIAFCALNRGWVVNSRSPS